MAAWCVGCIYNGEQCNVPPEYPHNDETKRLCKLCGWRVRRTASDSAVRKTASTGAWAEYLENR